MLSLKLDLSDVTLQMTIKGLAREPDEHDDEQSIRLLWTNTDFSLHGRFINYEVTDDELFMVEEVSYLKCDLEDLLNNALEEDCVVEFAEPDLSFYLYPAKRLYDEPGKVLYRNGYMDRELFAQLTVKFWCKKGGLGGNSFTMKMVKEDIEAFLIYLKTVTKELNEEDEAVQRMLSEGKIIRR